MSKKLRVSKTHRPEEVEEKEQEISPIERRRRAVVGWGVGVLIFAFAMTSGIVYTNLDQEAPTDVPEQQGTPVDQAELEIERWQQELADNPKDVAALANLGFYYRQKALPLLVDDAKKEEVERLLGLSEQNLRKALELDPHYGFAVQELATTLRMLKKDDEARKLLEQAIEWAQEPVKPAAGEDPETLKAARQRAEVEARMTLADIAFGQGKVDQAKEQLDKILELEPGNIDAYLGRASLYQKQDQKDLARADLVKALDISQKMQDRRAALVTQLLYQMDNPVAETPTPGAAPPAGAPTPGATPLVEAMPSPEGTPSTPATP